MELPSPSSVSHLSVLQDGSASLDSRQLEGAVSRILVLHFGILACRGMVAALTQFVSLGSRLKNIGVILSQESIVLVTPGCFGTFCGF